MSLFSSPRIDKKELEEIKKRLEAAEFEIRKIKSENLSISSDMETIRIKILDGRKARYQKKEEEHSQSDNPILPTVFQ